MNLPDNMTLQATLDSGKEQEDRRSLINETFSWAGKVSLLLAVMISPWVFGGIWHWTQCLMAISLLAGLAFWWFETALNRRDSQVVPYVAVPVILGIFIGMFQVLPLPAPLMNSIGGRQAELYERYSADSRDLLEEEKLARSSEGKSNSAAGVSYIKERLSMNPEATWNQIWLLLISLAGLLLGCRFFRTREDIAFLLAAITINGVAISVFAWFQNFTSPENTIYWTVELTQGGQRFGPYVNRNNAAGYLIMCLSAAVGLFVMVMGQRKTSGPQLMVSKEMPFWRQLQMNVLYFIADLTATKLSVLISIIVLITAIMSSLSRGGVMSMMIAGIVTFLFYGMARRPKNSALVLIPLVVLVLALSSWIGFSDQLIERFSEVESREVLDEEARFKNWADTFPATKEMGLLGAGLGSYSSVHRLYRTDVELRIFTFAENQYFQTLVEAGWPGFLLLGVALLLAWNCANLLIYRGVSPSSIAIGVLGIFLLIGIGVASIFDFGLYLPANALLMSVMVGFLSYHGQSLASRLKKQTWLRFTTPNIFVQILLLAVFAGVTLAALDHRRSAKIESLTALSLANIHYKELDLDATERKIKEIGEQVKSAPKVEAFNELGRLFVHRARLQYFEELRNAVPMAGLSKESREQKIESAWQYCKLDRMHEHVNFLKRDVSQYQAARFLEKSYITENLRMAAKYYGLSRVVAPLQPRVHLNLGKINSLISSKRIADRDLERAVELAPTSPAILKSVGAYYLQAGDAANCARHFRKYLELNPKEISKILRLVTARTNRKVRAIDDQTIYNSLIPDDPRMLFGFAVNYLDEDSPHRLVVLEKADLILGEASLSKRDDVLLSGRIKLEKGDLAAGVEQLEIAMISEPGDQKTRMQLVRLYLQQGRLQEAKEDAERLYRINNRKVEYQRLRQEVREAIKLKDQQEED